MMRNHLVSHCLCFLSLLLACSTHMVFYIWVCILRRFFSCPSCPLLSLFIYLLFFLNVQSVCTQSRNGPQKRSGWIKVAVIWMPFLVSLYVLYFLLTGKYLQVSHRRDPTADSIMHMPGCVLVCICVPRSVYISHVLSLPRFCFYL